MLINHSTVFVLYSTARLFLTGMEPNPTQLRFSPSSSSNSNSSFRVLYCTYCTVIQYTLQSATTNPWHCHHKPLAPPSILYMFVLALAVAQTLARLLAPAPTVCLLTLFLLVLPLLRLNVPSSAPSSLVTRHPSSPSRTCMSRVLPSSLFVPSKSSLTSATDCTTLAAVLYCTVLYCTVITTL